MKRLQIKHLSSLAIVTMTAGCLAGTFGRIVVENEQNRLAELRKWEESLAPRDCAELETAYGDLNAQKDDFQDFDQRMDVLRDQMEEKVCTLPEGLS